MRKLVLLTVCLMYAFVASFSALSTTFAKFVSRVSSSASIKAAGFLVTSTTDRTDYELVSNSVMIAPGEAAEIEMGFNYFSQVKTRFFQDDDSITIQGYGALAEDFSDIKAGYNTWLLTHGDQYGAEEKAAATKLSDMFTVYYGENVNLAIACAESVRTNGHLGGSGAVVNAMSSSATASIPCTVMGLVSWVEISDAWDTYIGNIVAEKLCDESIQSGIIVRLNVIVEQSIEEKAAVFVDDEKILVPEAVTTVAQAYENNVAGVTKSNSIGWYLDEACNNPASDTTPIADGTKLYTKMSTPEKIILTPSGSTAAVRRSSTSITGDVVIPKETADGTPVTAVADQAFYNCTQITSVTVPDGVTSVGNNAFQNCTNLETVTLPTTLTNLGTSAFSNATNLNTITLNSNDYLVAGSLGIANLDYGDDDIAYLGNEDNPSVLCVKAKTSITSATIPEGCISIGFGAFESCSQLTTVSLPDTVRTLNERAFQICSKLTSITIPDGVTSLGASCFKSCSKLTSITIPESVTGLGNECFSWSGLTSITIPNSVTSLGNSCFYYCRQLASITIPSSVTSLGNECFCYCENLTSIVIPSSVTSLGASCFSKCSKLTSITIPNSVTSLGSGCFNDCGKLTSITIPESVTSLGVGCFSSCHALTSIVVDDDNPVYNDGNGSNCIIRTSDMTMVQGCITTIIPNGVTSLGNSCFWGCLYLASITIPNSVTSFGDECFQGCRYLTSITIPNGVTSIGNYCFSNCSSLTSITIPSSVTSLGDYCFSSCSKLTSIIIPNSVTSLGKYCFSSCSSLTSITIPSSVTSLGQRCFYSCTSLTYITIPEGVTSLWEGCFLGCTSLTSITIPSSVTSLGSSCFYECYLLASITFEDINNWYLCYSESATSGTAVDVTNPSTNVTYLKTTYKDKYWKKFA